MLIEQAIFTSAKTCRREGYQIVAASPGLDALDLSELAAMGPSHDALWDLHDDASSANFFPLTSGRYCVSRTTHAGQEYSARRGPRVYTRYFVAEPESLAAFSNNPLALLAAASGQGHFHLDDRVPAALEPVLVSQATPAVDEALLMSLMADGQARWLAALVEAVLAGPSVALAAPGRAERLMAGVINCLPLECRLEASFSTGLRYSTRRPFRLVWLGGDVPQQRRLAHRHGLPVVDLESQPPNENGGAVGWGRFIARCFAAGNIQMLAEQLSVARPGLTISDLAALGERVNARLDAGGLGVQRMQAPDGHVDRDREAASHRRGSDLSRAPNDSSPAAALAEKAAEERRADGAHTAFIRPADAPTAHQIAWTDDPSQVVGEQCPAAIEKLELLDDLVFESIAGKPGALDELRKLWPEALAQVGPALVEESREQYLRHALRVWKECVDGEQIHNPTLALATMEVLCLLFAEK